MGNDSSKDATTVQSSSERDSPPALAPGMFRVVHSPDPAPVGAWFELTSREEVFPVGRDVEPNGLSVNDPRMSRLHARLTYDPSAQAFRFGDARSSNGCFHNGLRAETALLRSGDLLRMGDTLLVFERARPMAELHETISRVAASSLALLITGESGTGKELVARRVHELSGRTGSFVAVNCAALPRELVASELFGHTRGAFSSATHARGGLFMSAQDGTLLLDELGDLPLEQQPALLRVLQERSVRPVGADRELKTTARVIAATHADLEERVRTGSFRADLFARIAQCILPVPALRQRRSEILELALLFAERAQTPLTLSADAAERLVLWHWPFNVRELEAMIQTFAVLTSGTPLDSAYLRARNPALLSEASAPEPAGPANSTSARTDLERLMREHSGNISAVARALGKPRAQIYRWLHRYGIEIAGNTANKGGGGR